LCGMAAFQWSDLFAAGAGLDVAGGFLLASGLIVGSDEILRRTITRETFFSAPETASKISDKVDATLGVWTLIVGFAVQAAAYAVVAGGISNGQGSAAGAAIAVGIAVAAAVVAVAIWRYARWPLARKIITDIATDPLQLGANYNLVEDSVARPPSLFRIVPLAAEFGHRPKPGESGADFARRVFKLDAVSTDIDPLATAYRPARLG
jgi:hypothetical protein